jgi:uncharacterized protein YsxB (DUF464 family)
MIKVDLIKKNDQYISLSTSGHAGYDEYGKDIVCAAASILIINTINSIERFTDDKFSVKQDQESGIIDLKFKSASSEKSKLLIDSMVFGLKEIQRKYDDKYLIINIQEV